MQELKLDTEGLIPLETRFLHNPDQPHGFRGAALSSNVIHFPKVVLLLPGCLGGVGNLAAKLEEYRHVRGAVGLQADCLAFAALCLQAQGFSSVLGLRWIEQPLGNLPQGA